MSRGTGNTSNTVIWAVMIVTALVLPMTVFAGGEAEQNANTVQKCFDCFSKGDIEGVLELMAEDYVQVMPGDPNSVPWAGTWVGREGFFKFGKILSENREAVKVVREKSIAQGDKVVVPQHETMRILSTGRIVELDAVAVFTLKDGKITRLVFYEDTAGIAEGFRK